jgi:hypothetical protein
MRLRTQSAPARLLVWVAAGWLISLFAPLPATTQPNRPQPPPPRTQRYDPDAATCTQESLEGAYRRQLLPWADQSEAILSRLRQLQAEMLRASLRRCQERGLLTPDQVQGVEQRLGLPAASTSSSGQRP